MRRTSYRSLLILLVAVLFVPAVEARSRGAKPVESASVQAIDAAVARVLADGVPGVSVAVQRDGRTIFLRAWGEMSIEQQRRVYPETIFQIGSVTKQFVAAAIVRLSELGMLRVDDPVTKWVPELNTRGHAITIEQLMTHTSGLGDYLPLITDAYKPMTESEVIALINAHGFVDSPGSRWAYSNSGYYMLGMIIERASGKPWGDYIREQFLLPLGLHATGRCARHVPAPDGYLILFGTRSPVAAADMSLAEAAGAFCSNTIELVRWSQALRAGKVVSPESYAKMTTRVKLNSGITPGYGYGVGLAKWEGKQTVAHGGSILGFLSHLVAFPDDGLTVAVLVNVTSLDVDYAGNLAYDIAKIWFEREMTGAGATAALAR